MSQKVFIFLGPPGSGKGTQAVRLADWMSLPHISTGDLFRENIKNGTDLGKKVKAIIDAGNLVSDDLVLDMLFDRVSQSDCVNGYILDGFPRTLNQAEALKNRLQSGEEIVVLNLLVPSEVIVARLTRRLTCSVCGSVFHKDHNPPLVEGICDRCGGKLIQRTDDSEDVVRKRLDVYHKQTEPLVAYYEKQGLLVNVNGSQKPETVFQELLSTTKS